MDISSCGIFRHNSAPSSRYSADECLMGAFLEFAWLEHVTRHDTLSKTTLQGTLEGGQCHGRRRKCWMDIIKEWTSVPMPEPLTRASCGKDWKRISAESSAISPRWPSWSRVWTELKSLSFGWWLVGCLILRLCRVVWFGPDGCFVWTDS